MLNVIWLAMMVTAVVFGIIDHRLSEVVNAVTDYAKLGFEISLGLTGIMVFWLGLMNVAQESGLMDSVARILNPLMRRLFPDVPAEHPAMGAMLMNITANMLGLANAATPLGLKAMNELESINPNPGVASNAMCTFLALNTSSVQLLPTTAIAYLAANGATHPTSVIMSALLATSCSTFAAIIAVKTLARLPAFRLPTPVGEQ